MKTSVRFLSILKLSVAISLFAGGAAFGQTSQPAVDEILNRYVEASGGKAAFEKIKNRISRGTFEIPAQGIKGSIIVYEVAPSTQRAIIEMAGIGKAESGTDGNYVFETSTMSGPRLLTGEEKATAMRQAVFSSPLKLKEMYKTISLAGEETVDNRPTRKLILTPAVGNPETWYFDKETGLLARIDLKTPVQGVVQDMQSYLSEYRKADGLMLPFMTRQKIGGMEQLIRLESVAHNVDLPKDALEIPKDVKALMEKEKSAPASNPAPSSKPSENKDAPKPANKP